MRPDRFGKSRHHVFVESAGREREHPFEGGGILFSSVQVTLYLHGFTAFAQTDFQGRQPGLANADQYVAYTTPLRLFRRLRSVEDITYDRITPPFGYENYRRELSFRAKTVAKGGFNSLLTDDFEASMIETGARPNYIIGGSVYNQEGGTLTARSLKWDSLPTSSGRATQLLEEEFPLESWLKLLSYHLTQIADFPVGGRHQEYAVTAPAGAVLPTDPQFSDYDTFERTPIFSGSAVGYGNTEGFAVTEATSMPLAGTTYFLMTQGTIKLSMTKTLFRLIDLPATVKRWDVSIDQIPFLGAATPAVREMVCEAVPATEVLPSPEADFTGMEFVKGETRFFFRRYQFPGSRAPTDLPIQPSCAPGYV